MTALPSQSTPDRHQDPCRESQVEILGSIAAGRIGKMTVEELARIRITPVSYLTDPVIEFPKEWMPGGVYQKRSRRSVDIAKLASASHPLGSPGYEKARIVILQLLLAMWVVPRHYARRGTLLLKPSSYVQQCNLLITIARQALERGGMANGTLFAGLSHDAMRAILESSHTPKAQAMSGLIVGLNDLGRRGYVADWFREMDPVKDLSKKFERGRLGVPILRTEPDKATTWQPLPDAFVTEFGWRCLWFIENLGPSLIECYADCTRKDWPRELYRGRRQGPDRRPIRIQAHRQAVIEAFDWRSTNGDRIEKLPFDLSIIGLVDEFDRGNARVAWPPKHFRGISQCLTFLQTCHMFVVMLTMGARWGEVSSLGRACLAEKGEDGDRDRLEGKTWKLVDEIGGAYRDWPLHPLAVAAVRQQIKLADVRHPDRKSLWVSPRGKGAGNADGLTEVDGHLRALADAFGVTHLLGGTSFHTHRFRKTVARLAALALVGAPKILMDLFGHKSIEMTLRYILSDPTLAAEIQEVAKAQVIMLGEQAVVSADANGGPAAEPLRKGIVGAMRGDGKALGADDIREAAEILTMQGKSAQLVRPNVLCTKGPREAGRCTKTVGHPDPSRCKAHCGHRLELAAARDDVEKAISQCVAMLHDAAVVDDEMQWAFWRGQLKHHIARFEDIGARWRQLPDVMRILHERNAA